MYWSKSKKNQCYFKFIALLTLGQLVAFHLVVVVENVRLPTSPAATGLQPYDGAVRCAAAPDPSCRTKKFIIFNFRVLFKIGKLLKCINANE